MLAEQLLNFGHLTVIERLACEPRVDEEAVALVGWNATRRGMGRGNEAELFEIRHDVADRGSRQPHPQVTRQRARAHRLSIADVVLDEQLQELLCPVAQE